MDLLRELPTSSSRRERLRRKKQTSILATRYLNRQPAMRATAIAIATAIAMATPSAALFVSPPSPLSGFAVTESSCEVVASSLQPLAERLLGLPRSGDRHAAADAFDAASVRRPVVRPLIFRPSKHKNLHTV